jgi:dienelactone hydrolase
MDGEVAASLTEGRLMSRTLPSTAHPSPAHRAAVAVLAILISSGAASATEPYRTLSPPGDAPHPAVLLVPGCSGFAATNGVNHYDERAGELQAAGYAVVFVDSIGRRGMNNCAHVARTEVAADIIEAATWARTQTGIDPARIAVIGWSYGGGGVLAAMTSMPPGPPAFVKAALYYPDCRGARPWPADGAAALLLLGALDDVARPALCDPVVTGAPAARVRAITYPDARHGFDVPSLPARDDQPFGTIGYNEAAAKASWAAVLDFLR